MGDLGVGGPLDSAWGDGTDWPEPSSDLWTGVGFGSRLNLNASAERPPLSLREQERLCVRITQLPGQALHELKRLIKREDAGALQKHDAQWEFDTTRLAPALLRKLADLVDRHLGADTGGGSLSTSSSSCSHSASAGIDPMDLGLAVDAVSRRASVPSLSGLPPLRPQSPLHRARPRSALADVANGPRDDWVPALTAKPSSVRAMPLRRHSALPSPSASSRPALSSSAPQRQELSNRTSPQSASPEARKKRGRAGPALKLYRGEYLESLSGIKVFRPLETAEKPGNIRFMCDRCEKGFRKRSEILIHMRVHTGERPLKCAHCEQTFAHPSNRNAHERSHRGAGKFACDFPDCGKAFKSAASLKEHALGHENRFQFPCALCDHKFRSVENLDKHMRASHADAAGAALDPALDLMD